ARPLTFPPVSARHNPCIHSAIRGPVARPPVAGQGSNPPRGEKEPLMAVRKLLWGMGILALALPIPLVNTSVSAQPTTGRSVTFTKDVAPIFQAKCQDCHEPGSIAPMSLITYQEVRPWAKSIRSRVAARQMPPWHIDQSVGVQKFKNDMSLTDAQIDTIV